MFVVQQITFDSQLYKIVGILFASFFIAYGVQNFQKRVQGQEFSILDYNARHMTGYIFIFTYIHLILHYFVQEYYTRILEGAYKLFIMKKEY